MESSKNTEQVAGDDLTQTKQLMKETATCRYEGEVLDSGDDDKAI